MIEDQVAPKRCGHTKGKDVVGRDEAVQRVQAACDARDEGADILILARTDARTVLGMEEVTKLAPPLALLVHASNLDPAPLRRKLILQ